MYTEKSIELKSDFYSRYGEASGTLIFERTGVPCVIMDSGTHMLAFALGCGVRAYGRAYGDVLRIINADSQECSVSFVQNGTGAQILYHQDIRGIKGLTETTEYTISKLLCRMRGETAPSGGMAELCDRYGSGGWCAYYERGKVRQIPLPLIKKNVLLIRIAKPLKKPDDDLLKRFAEGETDRITAAVQGLKKCRDEALLDMLNGSELSIEHLLSPSRQALCAVDAAREADGVLAARITDIGVICVTESGKTDSAIRRISAEYERRVGYSAGIIVVK